MMIIKAIVDGLMYTEVKNDEQSSNARADAVQG